MASDLLGDAEKELLSGDERIDYFLKHELGNDRVLAEIKAAGADGLTVRDLKFCYADDLRERVCERLVCLGVATALDAIDGTRRYYIAKES